ncbi:hypothetical protein HG530_015508 [Fusarium avenaceum]|nr:hypothetical protein HG530_015508 [Fusarium avenaceum]
MELTTNLSHGSSEECTKCLFLSSSNITKDTNVLRENVLASTKDGNRGRHVVLDTRSVWRNIICLHLLKLGKNAANLEALFEVVVLVSINKLNVFATVEDDRMVLVVGFPVAKDRVARKLDAKLGATHAVLHNLRVAVNENRV